MFLGRERRRWFAENGMREEAAGALRRVGAEGLPLDRAGAHALARAAAARRARPRRSLPGPRVLMLDEPTASLGVAETPAGRRTLIREIRGGGAGILLVTHDLEQVFGLADRVVVLRQGRVVADVSPLEVHRDDVVALMSGIEMDSAARRQLHRLRSLVDQLSDVEPGGVAAADRVGHGRRARPGDALRPPVGDLRRRGALAPSLGGGRLCRPRSSA